MAHAIAYFLFVAELIWLFDSRVIWSAILLWPALSFAVAGIGYLFNMPGVFGKRADGSISPFARFLHMPFFFVGWLAVKLRVLTRKTLPCHEIVPKVWLGEYDVELPKSIERIVDLTCEYPRMGREIKDYHCIATLDGKALEIKSMASIVQICVDNPKPTYIHYFAGKGRSATFFGGLSFKNRQSILSIKLKRT